MTKKGIPSDWIKHLPSEESRKEFEASVRHDTMILGRLLELIEEKIALVDRDEISSTSYENPSWAYKQAHQNGIRNGLTQIKNLLTFIS